MNTVNSIMNEVATAHGLTAQTLADSIKAAGWDMCAIADHAGNPTVADLIRKIAAGYAETMAKAAARKAQIEARAEAERLASQTPAARANPQIACTRCDGKGRIRGFEHRENGVCYACGGKGVWQPRRRRG
jgi:DnaJ-class molecular chaperone